MKTRTPTTGDFLVERVIQILIRLYSKEHLSKAELALEYGVSERTIQRDIMQRLGHLSIVKDEIDRYYLKDNEILKTYKKELKGLLKTLLGEGKNDILEKFINYDYFPISFQSQNEIHDMVNFNEISLAILEQKYL